MISEFVGYGSFHYFRASLMIDNSVQQEGGLQRMRHIERAEEVGSWNKIQGQIV